MKHKPLKDIIIRSQRFLGLGLLVFISIIYATNAIFQMKKDWENQVSTMTRIVAKNIVSSILFSDKESAQNTLKSLDGESNMLSATLYDSQGGLFATFSKSRQTKVSQQIKGLEEEDFNLDLKTQIFTFSYPISYQEKNIGYLIVKTSTEKLNQFLINFLSIVMGLFVVILLLVEYSSNRIQKKLTGPLVLLLNIFENIKKNANYDERLPVSISEYNYINEFHQVGLSFNEMFEKIEIQNNIISKAKDNLEELVEKRTKELDEEKVKLVQAGKMASLGEMASGIAHEINNPLAIISSYLHIILKLSSEKKLGEDQLNTLLDKMITTVQRISSIIAGLKNFSRDSSHEDFKSVTIKKIIDDTLQFCSQRFVSGGVELIINEFQEDLEIECNATQISQVMLNLFNNSYDAVSIMENPWVKFELVDIGDYVKLIFSDSGSGIPLEIQEKVLQPFFTTKEIGKGTGLGLSISRGIVEAHNGKLAIDNKRENTTFVLNLPKKTKRNSKENK